MSIFRHNVLPLNYAARHVLPCLSGLCADSNMPCDRRNEVFLLVSRSVLPALVVVTTRAE